MIHLYSNLDNRVKYKEKIYTLNVSFDVVLKVLNIFGSDFFSEFEKQEHAFNLLLNAEEIEDLDIEAKGDLVGFIFDNIINFEPNREPIKGTKKKEPVMCFDQDVAELYSSFKEQYNIDLFEEQGKLHWIKFNFLVSGLNASTAQGSIMQIRQEKPPKKIDDSNREGARQLKRLQRHLKIATLETEKAEDSFNDDISNVGLALLKLGGVDVNKNK